MHLTEEPEIVIWPATHYVFMEKAGPFMQTAQLAWQTLHSLLPALVGKIEVTGHLSLYHLKPPTYRAGISIAAPTKELPEALQYEEFAGGKYSRFVLTGSYANLPQASGRVMQIISERHIQVRDDYFIENYTTDPRTTPEDQLVTEILVPTV